MVSNDNTASQGVEAKEKGKVEKVVCELRCCREGFVRKKKNYDEIKRL